MSAYITAGGTLLKVGCPTTLTRDTDQQVSFSTTLGGKRKGFVRKGERRTWSINVDTASPAEVSTIEQIARNMGPVGWYSAEATAGNLLSPQASAWEPIPTNATDAGLIQLPDGTVARAIASSGVVSPGEAHGGYEMVPVRPGAPITLAGWGMGGIRFTGRWRDATQQTITTFGAPAHSFTGWEWHSDTVTPPAGASYVQLSLSTGTQYARPSIAWGSEGRDELGNGCPVAVIHSPSHTTSSVWNGGNWTDSSYRVTEVG